MTKEQFSSELNALREGGRKCLCNYGRFADFDSKM